jgi:L-lactate dehydrogenase complex protein LldG
MESRERILGALRDRSRNSTSLPEVDDDRITYDDACRQLIEVSAAVGAEALLVAGVEQVGTALERVDAYRTAQNVCALLPKIGRSNVDPQTLEDPHALPKIDFAVVPGVFAVAENGAVWVTDEGIQHRAILFLAEHLALVVPKREIVHNMYEAYERLAFEAVGFGVFISGPSKTADIEQALVIGAQGPRSLTLFLTES